MSFFGHPNFNSITPTYLDGVSDETQGGDVRGLGGGGDDELLCLSHGLFLEVIQEAEKERVITSNLKTVMRNVSDGRRNRMERESGRYHMDAGEFFFFFLLLLLCHDLRSPAPRKTRGSFACHRVPALTKHIHKNEEAWIARSSLSCVVVNSPC